MPWKIVKSENEYCVHKENADGSAGEVVACHESEEKAQAQLRALYANEERMSAADRLIDEFVTVKPGEPIRLFPWGAIVKNGKRREIKPGMGWRIPHFKPAIKLGSHEDATPAGGHITGLEERDDGLYALLELNDRGAQAIQEGAYRYHSPEVIWEGAGFENPLTGESIPGPLIVGDALLHMPHLGEAAALYSVQEVNTMTMETVEVPKTWWESLSAIFKRAAEPEPPEAPAPADDGADKFAAITAERDQYRAELEEMKAEAQKRQRVDGFAAQLAETKAEPNAEMLASMTDDQATWVIQQFKALSAQINESALTGEIGSEGAGLPTDPVAAFDQAVKAYAAEHKLEYAQALQRVAVEQPDLYRAYSEK